MGSLNHLTSSLPGTGKTDKIDDLLNEILEAKIFRRGTEETQPIKVSLNGIPAKPPEHIKVWTEGLDQPALMEWRILFLLSVSTLRSNLQEIGQRNDDWTDEGPKVAPPRKRQKK